MKIDILSQMRGDHKQKLRDYRIRFRRLLNFATKQKEMGRDGMRLFGIPKKESRMKFLVIPNLGEAVDPILRGRRLSRIYKAMGGLERKHGWTQGYGFASGTPLKRHSKMLRILQKFGGYSVAKDRVNKKPVNPLRPNFAWIEYRRGRG